MMQLVIDSASYPLIIMYDASKYIKKSVYSKIVFLCIAKSATNRNSLKGGQLIYLLVIYYYN